MKLLVCDTPVEASVEAARVMRHAAQRAIDARGSFWISLSGGSTPPAIFRALGGEVGFPPELVRNTLVTWGDERSVPNDHKDSNVRLAEEHLLGPMDFPPENVFRPNGGAEDLHEEARRYEHLLRRIVPVNEDDHPVLDLVLLGMGPDGHTASLFPGTEALVEATHSFVANEVPQLATWRLTLTFPAINAGGTILFVATGASKAPVMRHILSASEDDARYPAQRVTGDGSNVLWIVDAAAVDGVPEEVLQQHRVASLIP